MTGATDLNQLAVFETEKKSVGAAYVLALLFGVVFAHRYYLGKTLSASLLAGLFLVGFLAAFVFGEHLTSENLLNAPAEWKRWLYSGGRILMIAVVILGLIIDLLFLPVMVRDANRKILDELGIEQRQERVNQ